MIEGMRHTKGPTVEDPHGLLAKILEPQELCITTMPRATSKQRIQTPLRSSVINNRLPVTFKLPNHFSEHLQIKLADQSKVFFQNEINDV